MSSEVECEVARLPVWEMQSAGVGKPDLWGACVRHGPAGCLKLAGDPGNSKLCQTVWGVLGVQSETIYVLQWIYKLVGNIRLTNVRHLAGCLTIFSPIVLIFVVVKLKVKLQFSTKIKQKIFENKWVENTKWHVIKWLSNERHNKRRVVCFGKGKIVNKFNCLGKTSWKQACIMAVGWHVLLS